MIHGLYFSAQGAQLQSMRQDVIANNLANASTTAFKRDLLRAQAFAPRDVAQEMGPQPPGWEQFPGGLLPAETITDFSQGPLVSTQSPLDLAITGEAFFQVSNGGEQFVTREGRMSINPRGELVTRDSNLAVLGSNGRPIVGLDPTIVPEIGSDGRIVQAGTEVAQIGLVQPANPRALEKTGTNLYVAPRDLASAGASVTLQQGYLEGSGTRPMTEMMEMIESSRALEANVNMIKYQDEALGQLLQGVGRK